MFEISRRKFSLPSTAISRKEICEFLHMSEKLTVDKQKKEREGEEEKKGVCVWMCVYVCMLLYVSLNTCASILGT